MVAVNTGELENFEDWMRKGQEREAAFNWIMDAESRELAQMRFEKFMVLFEEEAFSQTFIFVSNRLLSLRLEPGESGPESMISWEDLLQELKDEENNIV